MPVRFSRTPSTKEPHILEAPLRVIATLSTFHEMWSLATHPKAHGSLENPHRGYYRHKSSRLVDRSRTLFKSQIFAKGL